jgi:periplasmic protein TonB
MAEVRANLFYERDEWKTPLMISVAFHFGLVLAIAGLGYVMAPHGSTNWGTNSGEAVEAQLVASAPIPIPKPQEPTQNIVANENKGVAETQPQPKEVETEDGIAIKGKVTPKKTIDKPITPTHTPPRPVPTPVDTAVPYGEGGPVSGPYGSFTAPNTKGGVSVQEASFGDKYPFYIKGIRDAVQRNWRTYEIDPRITAPHRAFIEFEVSRDGSPHNVQIAQSSGVPSLDISAKRAIERIDGFGALPEGSVLHVQFWFDYPPK